MQIDYARVSATKQSLWLQHDALSAATCAPLSLGSHRTGR